MKCYLDLFSGIGGFPLAAYWAGLRFDKHFFSEIDPYAVKLYKKRFPEAEYLGDIKSVNYKDLPKGEWFVTGGFPCQPHSVSGKRKGITDERDLWPECARMLREIRPKIALFENVPGLFTSDGGSFFNRVLSDISENGYDCEWKIISAQDVGAPHLRKRVWIVAYPKSERLQREWPQREQNIYPRREERPPKGSCHGGGKWPTEPCVGRVAHGVPSRMDRIKSLGNSIVPQCAELIFNLPAFDYWREVI